MTASLRFRPPSPEEAQRLTGLPVRGVLFLTGAEVENERSTHGCLSMKLEHEPRESQEDRSDPMNPLHVLLTPPAAYQLARALEQAVKDYLGAEATEELP